MFLVAMAGFEGCGGRVTNEPFEESSGGTASGGQLGSPSTGGTAATGGAAATGGSSASGGVAFGGEAPTGGEGGVVESLGGAIEPVCQARQIDPAIRKALENSKGETGVPQPSTVTQLVVSSGGIHGIECFENLERLTLVVDSEMRSGLSLLEKLPNLVSLAVSEMSDLGFVEDLDQLEELTIGGGQDIDLEPIAELSNLVSLTLSNTEVLSLAPLAPLDQLDRFVIFDVAVVEDQTEPSAFMAGWALEELTLIGGGVPIAPGQLDTSRLRQLRVFGTPLQGITSLAPAPSGGGSIYHLRGAIEAPGETALLCDAGWKVIAQPTWCSSSQDDLCEELNP